MPTDAGSDRPAPWGRGRARRGAALLTVALAMAAPARAHVPALSPEGVAAVVLNVARFTRWPDAAFGGSSDALRICVRHDCPMRAALARLDGQVVGARTVAVVAVAEPWTARCHVVFVSDALGLAGRAAQEAGPSVLLVSDAPDFAALGGAVGLVGAPGGVAFEVNVAAVERAGLGMSSKLLRLARSVGR